MDRHSYQGQVPFADTDMAGIVHHANYFRYMEAAEHAFWRAAGFSAVAELDGVRYGWPRVHASCDYRQPLRFEDAYTVQLFVTRIGEKSVHFLHLISRDSSDSVTAVGRISVVCMRLTPGAAPQAIVIPPPLRACLQVAPPGDYEQFL